MFSDEYLSSNERDAAFSVLRDRKHTVKVVSDHLLRSEEKINTTSTAKCFLQRFQYIKTFNKKRKVSVVCNKLRVLSELFLYVVIYFENNYITIIGVPPTG